MDSTGSQDRKEAIAARIKHLEAELNGALEVVAEESMPIGGMLPMPPTSEEDMMPTIRDFEREIEELKAEYEKA